MAIVLPPSLAEKFWSRVRLINVAPKSQRLEAFRNCAHDVKRFIGPILSPADVADRLYEAALSTGIVLEWGEDAVQGVLTEALASSADDFEEDGALDDDDVRSPQFSDEALALLFAERHGHQLKYVEAWNKWQIWTGTVWGSDETLQVLDLARRLCREIASSCSEVRVGRCIASKKTVSAVVSLARADRRIAATIEQWDDDPWLLNTPSGIVDLRSGRQRPHSPSDYLTKITAVAPDPSCPIPFWLAFLDRACKADSEFVDFLQRIVGYSLTGLTTEHALFFCYGTGANGKSTFINAATGCIGDYHQVAPIETFTAANNDRHPTELAGLRGARLVTAVETEEGRRWAESKIKSLTGGDKIAARFMRQDFFLYRPAFKLLIAGNHKPGLRTVDEAIRRRLHLLPFISAIPPEERDEKLGEKLRGEWPGILSWAIRGCLDWQSRGLKPPPVVLAATTEYLEAEDALSAWIDEAGHRDPNAFALTQDLFSSWKKYAQIAGEYVGSVRKFSQRMEDRADSIGLRKGRDNAGRRGFFGLRLYAPTMEQVPDDVVPL
jgi:putative DNA primase/helicase